MPILRTVYLLKVTSLVRCRIAFFLPGATSIIKRTSIQLMFAIEGSCAIHAM